MLQHYQGGVVSVALAGCKTLDRSGRDQEVAVEKAIGVLHVSRRTYGGWFCDPLRYQCSEHY